MSKILLKDRVEFVYGFSVRVNNEQTGEYPVFGSNGPTGFIDSFKVSGPGVIIGRKGSVGKINFTKKNFTPTDTTYYLQVKDSRKDDLKFWYYYLPLLGLEKLNTHSSVPGLSREVAYLIPVSPPNLLSQQKIASILSTLDTKIELNNKINTELEAMAKTLYNYWFVQFDFPCLPQDYRPSGQVNLELSQKIQAICTYTQVGGLPLPDGKKWFVYVILCKDGSFYKGMTNDLYRRYYEHKTGQGAEWTKTHKPIKIIHYEEFENQNKAAEKEKELKTGFGRTWLQREYDKFLESKDKKNGSPAPKTKLRMAGEMVWNEELKRDIPKGWEVKKISDLVEKYSDKSVYIESKNILDFGNYPVITQDNGEFIAGFTNEENPIEDVPVIIFGDHSCTLRYIDFPFFRGADGTQIMIFDKNLIIYIYLFLQSIITKIPNYGKYERHYKYLKEFQLVIPKLECLNIFLKIIEPVIEKISKSRIENQKLAELRDFLLPMLMNGQVVVE